MPKIAGINNAGSKNAGVPQKDKRELSLALGVIVVMSVLWPDTLVLLFLDGNLNGNVVALLLVLLGAVLLGYLVALGDGVVGAVLLRHIVTFGDVDVVTLFMRDFLAFLLVVVRRLALFDVSGLTLLFLFVSTFFFV